jgi:2-hydroxy-3-oxopropionate reductase
MIKETKRYGLIGLGNVGSDLAAAALAAGFELHAYDLAEAARERVADLGATLHPDPVSLAREVDVLVLSLPNADVVDDVLLHGGALDALRPGSLLIDMSTNLPDRAKALAVAGERRSIGVLDAPVSYGPRGLVTFVGGAAARFEDARPWLETVTVAVTHVGPAGHGQYVKLIQNILSGVGMGVVAEIIGFAEHAGVDLGVLPEALRDTGAHSPMLERTFPVMVQRRYGTTGTMALHTKDMGYALRTAEGIGARMPFTAALRGVFDDVLASGDPRWTQSAMVEWFVPARKPDGDHG